YNDTTGALNRAYELYYSPNGQNGRFDLFAKANGLGELVARTAPPPIEIGDRVWQDTNRDGVQDAGEAGLGGLTVRLVDDAGATVSTAVTDANGYFLFSSLAGTSTASVKHGLTLLTTHGYQIRMDMAQGPIGGR